MCKDKIAALTLSPEADLEARLRAVEQELNKTKEQLAAKRAEVDRISAMAEQAIEALSEAHLEQQIRLRAAEQERECSPWFLPALAFLIGAGTAVIVWRFWSVLGG